MVSLSLNHDTLQPALNSSINKLMGNFNNNQIVINEEELDTLYYTEYNCEFWQCVKDSIASSSFPLVLFSEKAKEYWTGKFILLAVLSFVLFVLILLISRNRSTTFIVTGILLIISALPFRKLDWVLKFVNEQVSSIFSVFFTKAHTVFIIMLVIGIIFIVWGILCKIFGWKIKFKKDEEITKKDSSDSKHKKKDSK
jgi:uncharacterized membrane protein HdeD (DUF308 family)